MVIERYQEGDEFPKLGVEVDKSFGLDADDVDNVEFVVINENNDEILRDSAEFKEDDKSAQTDTENDGTFHGIFPRSARKNGRQWFEYDWSETLDAGWYWGWFEFDTDGKQSSYPRGRRVTIRVVRGAK